MVHDGKHLRLLAIWTWNEKPTGAGRLPTGKTKRSNQMLQNGPIFNNRNLIPPTAGALREGQMSLDPKDRLALRLLTVHHRSRLRIELATLEAIGAIFDEYIRDLQEAAA